MRVEMTHHGEVAVLEFGFGHATIRWLGRARASEDAGAEVRGVRTSVWGFAATALDMSSRSGSGRADRRLIPDEAPRADPIECRVRPLSFPSAA